MIKKLQALKAKKGFTLVELVVVIAIIGVLAAILIPVMVGVVQDANITSANTLAKTIYSNTQSFMTNADTHQNPLKHVGKSNVVVIHAEVSAGNWTVVAPVVLEPSSGGTVPQFGGGDKYFFGHETAHSSEFTKDNCLKDNLQSVARDFKDGAVNIYLQDSACIGVAVEQGAGLDNKGVEADDTALKGIKTDLANAFKTGLTGSTNGEMDWSGDKAGLIDGGVIIGTNPQLKMKVGS